MSEEFFKQPILNSPYDYPGRHWELDDTGQPTQNIKETRRRADFITPIPRAKRQSGGQQDLDIEELSDDQDRYANATIINALRDEVDRWRQIPNPADWKVTPETQRLLQHWRHHKFSGIRPFFCQVEAAETAIWLTEVAPKMGKTGAWFLDHLKDANQAANPDLSRLSLKLATGAGKTTVMAMLIAWQTINSVRHPTSSRYTRGFLIVAPGITIRDRLQVLQPNDPYSYYRSRELVPNDMLRELYKAEIVITNYHAFKLRERMQLSKGGRQLLQGRGGEELQTLESEGQMLQRVMPELMGMKNIMAINDEAHHCYREKPGDDEEEKEKLKGDERKEAEKNLEAARLWINGLEAVNRKLGLSRVMDLSATPFFLKGSGYVEGTLFPWTMSDFSLMDAIECGIVKLPRVPVADNIPDGEMPKFRNLWEHIRTKMPKKGRGKAKSLDPQNLPDLLKSALDALYGHYAQTFELWRREGVDVPPCFIVVCNNTATSKLVYDYIAGYEHENENGTSEVIPGYLELFRNYDEHGEPLARPRTLLIDSEQLESGEALDTNFRKIAADEIERFKNDIKERTRDHQAAANLTDADLLREVMNTVGKEGRLGGSIRCVVSVSMLTEGWDANNVTHVLGVRAFGTQLLCEQVIGRALRRQSYDLNEEGRFNVEYADVLGIPFDFTAKPVVAPPQPPRETIQVRAMRPERDHLEIRFPRVEGYRTELPQERLKADFTEDSRMVITPEDVGPTKTRNEGIIGEGIDLDLKHLEDMRKSSLVFHLAKRLLMTKWRDPGDEPELHFFGDLKRITRQWLDQCLECKGGTYPAQLMYQDLADRACDRITHAITRHELKKDSNLVRVVLDPYNPEETTSHVNFNTSNTERWKTSPERCHVNFAILDSGWEGEFCRILESHPRVLRYVKNHNLGLEVPYRHGSENRTYVPDFIIDIDDAHGEDDPLHLIVEIKGYRREDVKDKHNAIQNYWIPGVNNLGRFGRWDFAEFSDIWEMESEFSDKLEQEVDRIIQARLQEIPA